MCILLLLLAIIRKRLACCFPLLRSFWSSFDATLYLGRRGVPLDELHCSPASAATVAAATSLMAKRKPAQARSIQRPFVCEEPGCHRCFTRFDHLQRHALVHDEGAAKLPCPDCGKTFLRHDMLVRHQRSVHEPNKKGKRQGAARSAEEHGPVKKSKSLPPQASSSISSLSSFDFSSGSFSMPPLAGTPVVQGAHTARPSLENSATSTASWREPPSHKSSEVVSPVSERSWSSSMMSHNGSQFFFSSASTPSTASFPMLNNGGTAQSSAPTGATQFVLPPMPSDPSSVAQTDVHNHLPPFLGGLPNFAMPRDPAAFNPNVPLPSRGNDTLSAGFFEPTVGDVDIGSGSVSSASSSFAFPAYKMPPSFASVFGPRTSTSSVGGDNPAHVKFTSGTPTVPTQLSRLVVQDLPWSGNWHLGRNADAVHQGTTASSAMSMGSSYDMGASPFTPVVPSSAAEMNFHGMLQPSKTVLPQHAWLFDKAEELPRGGNEFQNGLDGVVNGLGQNPPVITDADSGSWVPLDSGESADTLDGALGQMQREPTQSIHTQDETGSEAKVQVWFVAQLPSIQDNPRFEVRKAARDRLLDFLIVVPELSSSTLFSPNHLSVFLSLFFLNWNRTVPMVHEGSFYPGEVSPALLAACVVVGSHFAEPPAAAELGQKIAAKLWTAMVSLTDFDPQKITLELLQALVLLDAYGTFCADRRLHELADCFHPLIVTFARRNALFDSKAPPNLDELAKINPESAWRQWVSHEEKIRVAHTIFMLDIQHASLFRHKPSLAALQRTLSLPAEAAEWEQKTAQEWREYRRHEHGDETAPKSDHNADSAEVCVPAKRSEGRLCFGAALKMCFSERSGLTSTPSSTLPSIPPALEDPFIRLLLFLGLTGLAYDLNHHSGFLYDQTSNSGALLTLKKKVYDAMKTWTAREDDGNSPSFHGAMAISMHIAGKLTMYADIITIQVSSPNSTVGLLSYDRYLKAFQIACGVNPLLGQYVGASTLAASQAAVEEWSCKAEARTAALIALQGLSLFCRDCGPATSSISATASAVDDAIVRNRVAYLCCVVLFAFTRAQQPAGERLGLTGSDAAQATGDFLEEARLWTETTLDVDEVHQHLGAILRIVEQWLAAARWELSREASATLRRLLNQLQAT
ncbi:hypothetical protein A4X03_0g2631 [Tilletia caries]|uniref:C2H2-type domain-containing protein n=3 Tax=Tilletia TaxID=13289 RepID=A0A177VA35_9BASI|nr:hypothetical protein A4X03_0g2631 [Tilletia caries]